MTTARSKEQCPLRGLLTSLEFALPGTLRVCATLIGMLLLVCGCGSGSGPTDTIPTDTIMTESGPVRGIHTGAVDEYLGVPYAAAPVDELRWLPPRPHGPWQGVLEAFNFGSECTQPGSSPDETAGSENCLFLNVYRPHHRPGKNSPRRLPVMVWIHGGALTILSGAFDVPPKMLEDGNVIVVSMNYRLGVLGFFAHPTLDAEGHLNANYGLMDQQFALRWVRRNIAAFGGDPHRITIFGTSAGALSVYSHLASPTAAGLFQRAIAQSGSYEGQVSYQKSIVPISAAETAGVAFANKFGCSTASCLRAVPAAQLVAAEPSNSYPILDGAVLAQCKPRYRHQEFLAFLRHIEANVPAQLDDHLVVDNYATHKHPKVQAWLARRPRWHIHFTPTYSSWLNQVERFFALITQRAIRRGSFESTADLVKKIDRFIRTHNANSQPFVWTATADSILQKLARLCQRISGTEH